MSERDERLLDLLERYRELKGQGRKVSAAEVCAQCPELLQELEEQIRFQRALEWQASAEAEPAVIDPPGQWPITNPPDEQEAEAALTGPGIPVIPNHDILSLPVSGGMGTVYRGRDRRLGRVVAVKVIKNGLIGPPQLARFQREAEGLARLNHAHIVQVYEIGRWQPPGGSGELPSWPWNTSKANLWTSESAINRWIQWKQPGCCAYWPLASRQCTRKAFSTAI